MKLESNAVKMNDGIKFEGLPAIAGHSMVRYRPKSILFDRLIFFFGATSTLIQLDFLTLKLEWILVHSECGCAFSQIMQPFYIPFAD